MTTRAQQAVLEALAGEESFLSAQEIHVLIRDAGSSVGLTSVYRAVQSLCDEGLVDVVRTPSGESTYRRCGSARHHHHLVCRECGAAVEVEAPALERWMRDVARRHGSRVDGHTVEITGTCSRCSAAR